MFLNQLSKSEKEAFISLSIYAAKSNGIYAEEEKVMLQEYTKEMEMESVNTDEQMKMEDIIVVFSKAELRIKKIVLLEILGLLYSDGEYDLAEKQFVSEYAEKIGLSDDIVKKLSEIIRRYIDVLKEVALAVE